MECLNTNYNEYPSASKCIFNSLYLLIKLIALRTKQIVKICVFALKFIFVVVIIFTSTSNLLAQETITLEMCHNSSDSLFPLANQYAILNSINNLEIETLKSGYFPSIDLNMRFSYQSKVTEVPTPVNAPGVSSPTVPHEQYGATVDLKQIIYDGGVIRSTKKLKQMMLESDVQQIETEQYKIKDRINQLFALCLIIQENEKIIELTKQNIQEQKIVLQSSVDNGFVNASELDNLTAELLKFDQQQIELLSHKKQVLSALNKLSCLDISLNDILELPEIQIQHELKIFRPEHEVFLCQAKVVDANIDLTGTQRLPKVFAFGTAGMGYPGLNMFSNQLDPYYIVGAQLTWNIWDWKLSKRNKDKLNIQKQLILNQEELFNKNIDIELTDARLDIKKLNQLILKDKEIIALREKITKRSASQLKNGTITSANYLLDLNAEKQAKINLKQRQIQFAQSKINLLTISGSNLFEKE